jgi:hypothetical protein
LSPLKLIVVELVHGPNAVSSMPVSLHSIAAIPFASLVANENDADASVSGGYGVEITTAGGVLSTTSVGG